MMDFKTRYKKAHRLSYAIDDAFMWVGYIAVAISVWLAFSILFV